MSIGSSSRVYVKEFNQCKREFWLSSEKVL